MKNGWKMLLLPHGKMKGCKSLEEPMPAHVGAKSLVLSSCCFVWQAGGGV